MMVGTADGTKDGSSDVAQEGASESMRSKKDRSPPFVGGTRMTRAKASEWVCCFFMARQAG